MLLRNGKNFSDHECFYTIDLEESFYNDSSSPWQMYYDKNHNYYIFKKKKYNNLKAK